MKKHDEHRHVFYIETGERFRRFIKEHSLSSRLAHKIYEAGQRQPDFLAVWMWSHLLVERMVGNEHIIFDGTPRSLPEAQIFTTAAHFYNLERPHVIHLEISREASKERLRARGRMDDVKEEEINSRLDWFEKDVVPAIEYFRHHPEYNFVEVNGEQTVEEIHQQIIAKIF